MEIQKMTIPALVAVLFLGIVYIAVTQDNDFSPNICGKTCPTWAEISLMKQLNPEKINAYLAWDARMKQKNFYLSGLMWGIVGLLFLQGTIALAGIVKEKEEENVKLYKEEKEKSEGVMK